MIAGHPDPARPDRQQHRPLHPRPGRRPRHRRAEHRTRADLLLRTARRLRGSHLRDPGQLLLLAQQRADLDRTTETQRPDATGLDRADHPGPHGRRLHLHLVPGRATASAQRNRDRLRAHNEWPAQRPRGSIVTQREPDPATTIRPAATELLVCSALGQVHGQTVHSGQRPAFDSPPGAEVTSLMPACTRPAQALTPATAASGLPRKHLLAPPAGVGSCRPPRPDRTLTAVKTAWAGLATSCAETSSPLGILRARAAARVQSESRTDDDG